MQRIPLPKSASEVMTQLSDTIITANAGLEADKGGDLQNALSNYSKVISSLLDILYYYYKTPNSNKKQAEILEEKRDKFLARVSALWQILDTRQKYEYGMVQKPIGKKKQRELHPVLFTDLNTSFLNIVNINMNLESFKKYNEQDEMISVMEKVERLAFSIKFGAFIKQDLFVPSDVWLLPLSRLENVEVKQNALQQLTLHLSRLEAVSKIDPQLKNIPLLRQTIRDVLPEFEQTKQALVTINN